MILEGGGSLYLWSRSVTSEGIPWAKAFSCQLCSCLSKARFQGWRPTMCQGTGSSRCISQSSKVPLDVIPKRVPPKGILSGSTGGVGILLFNSGVGILSSLELCLRQSKSAASSRPDKPPVWRGFGFICIRRKSLTFDSRFGPTVLTKSELGTGRV
ncbi:hypothetical protein TNCV_2582891 [Trichonephila clavipes]|nr:hypothetical protein TNCV_2582891 [Trichonephila clavipes]